jgi:hypothetical protein
MVRACFVLAAIVVPSALVVSGHARAAQTAPDRTPVIIELFTSEGCSSCPSADALLTKLSMGSPVANVLPITLSEHVDYWDQQGWRDPFSSASFTARQQAYSNGDSAEVYTPQMIVDGDTSFIGSDTAALVAALKKAGAAPKAPVAIAWSNGTNPAAVITLAPNPQTAKSSVVLAITEDGLSSAVRRGENAGRTLAHTSVTRRLSVIGQTAADGSFKLEVPVKLDSSWQRPSLKLVAFAQTSRHHIAAAGVLAVPATAPPHH